MSLKVVLGADISKFEKDMKRAEAILRKDVGRAALDLSRTMVKVASVITGATIAIGGAMIKMGADFEDARAKLGYIITDVEAASTAFRRLEDRFAFSRLSFSKLDEATRKFAGLGFSAEQATGAVKLLEDAAFASGEGEQAFQKMERSIEQLIARGTITDRSFINFTQSGIDAWRYLSEGIGVSVEEIRRKVSQGMISTADTLKHIFAGINREFGGAVEEMSRTTLTGATNMMTSLMRLLSANIGQRLSRAMDLQGLMNMINRNLMALQNMINSIGIRETFLRMFPTEYIVPGLIAIGTTIAGVLAPGLKLLAIKTWTAVAPLLLLVAKWAAWGTLLTTLYTNWDSLVTGVSLGILHITQGWEKFTVWFSEAWVRVVNVIFNGIDNIVTRTMTAISGFARVIPSLLGGDRIRRSLYGMQQGWEDVASSFTNMSSTYKKELSQQRKDIEAWSIATRDGIVQMQEAGKDAPETLGFITDALNKLKGAAIDFNLFPEEFFTGLDEGDIEAITKSLLNLSDRMGAAAQLEETQARRLAERRLDIARRMQEDLARTYLEGATDRLSMLDIEYEREKALINELAGEFEDIILAREQAEANYQKRREEMLKNGYDIEDRLQKAYLNRNLEDYANAMNQKNAMFMSRLSAEKEAMDAHQNFMLTANRDTLSKITEIYKTFSDGFTDALTNVIMGVENVGEAFENLGKRIIALVLRQRIEQEVSARIAQTTNQRLALESQAQAKLVAAEWRRAAMWKTQATGGSLIPSSASLFTGIIPFADGGVVTKPTLAMIGEAGEAEAVIPLSKLDKMMKSKSGGNEVTVNVVNNTGVQAQANKSSRFDGQKWVVDVVLDAYQRNVGGMQEMMGGR